MTQVEIVDPFDRSEIVLERLSEISKTVVQGFCEMAELLYEVWEYSYHKKLGYDSFQDYTEQILDVRGRKAHFLVQIAKTVKKLNIPWDDIKGVGWRKTAVIAPILNSENKEKWIEEAKGTPLAHLSEKVKAERHGREPSDTPPIRMTIQIDEDEQTIINSAIEYVKRMEGGISNSKALVKICYDFYINKEEN